MTKILPLLSISIVFVSVLTQAKAACDLNTSFITLTKKNADIEQIVKEIDKQTNYAIQIKNTDFLKTKKTIHLNNTPLPTCFTRLFKETNYSVICDTVKKTLQIVILEDSKKKAGKTVGSSSSRTNQGATPTGANTGPPPSQQVTESKDNWEYPPEPISHNHKMPKIKLDDRTFSEIDDTLE